MPTMLSADQCPQCFHVHLDYTDESCVSCGCSIEPKDLTVEALVDRLRAVQDHLERGTGHHPIVPMSIEGDHGFCGVCWHDIFETADYRGGRWRHDHPESR